MKNPFLYFLLCAFICGANFNLKSQNLIHEWSFGLGNASDNTAEVIATDNANNQLIAGQFTGTVDFDPGVGVSNVTATSAFDAFLAKFDDQGNLIWARQFPEVNIYDINFDASNNAYLTGTFQNTVDMDPGVGTFNVTSQGSLDAFVLKLDANGDFVDAISFGDLNPDQPFALTLDDNDNVYVTGTFANTVDFDPSASTNNLTASGADAFIVKYNNALDFQWVLQIGGTDTDGEEANITYNAGYLYITGIFRGTADINPTAGVQNETSAGDRDVYIEKLDTSGVLQWAYAFGGSGPDIPRDIICDNAGDVILVGAWNGTTDFDPGVGVISENSTSGSQDVFVVKYNPSGVVQWGSFFGGAGTDNSRNVVVDSQNNLYVGGWFAGTADFDPGAAVSNLTSGGSNDGYMDVLDASGSFIEVYQITGGSSVTCRSNDIDNNGNVYLFGAFQNTIDMDPGPGTQNATSAGVNDVMLIKLATCSDETTDVISECDSYTWIDGNTYTSSNNTATHLLSNQAGCDSLVTLDLTINNSTSSTDVIADCDPITWIDGNTYSQSNNTATHVITNSAGCDSTITLNFTLQSNSGTDVQNACDSLVWIDGQTYYADNNTATHTLTNINGCDSVVTLDLTVISNIETITQTSGTLSADQNAVNYQWIDCDNSFAPVSGATSQSFQPTSNGNYAVILEQGGCIDTSACVLVDDVSFDQNFDALMNVYPNPTTGKIYIEFNNFDTAVHIELFSADGKSVARKTLQPGTIELNMPNENGTYILKLWSDDFAKTISVVKI